jgi:signal transduction histidine kinase
MGALGGLATQCSELVGVNCRFVCHRPVLVNNNKVATNLYRIAQEAINNAVKHGRAREIEIRLFAIEGRPALRIIDDGIGFRGVAKEHKGMGLRTMNYRADLIGADFAIRRRKLRGTEVTCHLRA